MIRRTSLLALGLACVIALAGCSSDSPSSSSSSSPSPSAPPSPSASFAGPTMPSSAQGESRDGAKAFVQYWVTTLNFATDSGDTEGLKSLAAKDCTTCADFAGTLDQIYGAGGRVETGGWAVEAATPIADRPATKPQFQLALKLDAQTVYEKKGAKAKEFPGGDQGALISLVRQDDHWLVEKLDIR